MRLFYSIAVMAATGLLLVSCKPSDKKLEAAANEYCHCMQKIESGMGEESRRMVKEASLSDNPTLMLQKSVEALDEDKKAKVREEFMILGEMEDDNSELGRCLLGVDKKYKSVYSLNDDAAVRKILKKLETKPNCELTAAIMKLGLKVQK